MQRLPLSLLSLLPLPVVLTLALAAAVPSPAMAQSAAADLQLMQDAEPLRRVADAFVARAMAGDAGGAQALFSRALVERTGAAVVQRVLAAQILPFFSQGRETGRSVTVTRTTDASGNTGCAFYMWLQPAAGGAPRPFTVYTVLEDGRAVVANVVPDRLVEGRHR